MIDSNDLETSFHESVDDENEDVDNLNWNFNFKESFESNKQENNQISKFDYETVPNNDNNCDYDDGNSQLMMMKEKKMITSEDILSQYLDDQDYDPCQISIKKVESLSLNEKEGQEEKDQDQSERKKFRYISDLCQLNNNNINKKHSKKNIIDHESKMMNMMIQDDHEIQD